MKFPKKLIFKFISKLEKKPLSNCAIGLMVKAVRKNDYPIGPKFTNPEGEVFFTPEEIKEDIDRSQKAYLMDYASSFEECSSVFEVVLMSKKAIEDNLKWYKEHPAFVGVLISSEKIKELENAKNRSEKNEKWIVTPEMWGKSDSNTPILVFEAEIPEKPIVTKGPGVRS